MTLSIPKIIAASAVALLLPACEKSPSDAKKKSPRVALGDCAGPTARFESGPKPQAFNARKVETRMAALLAKQDQRKTEIAARLRALKEPTPAPEPDDPTTGGTGTAMALEEGKMGKPDNTSIGGLKIGSGGAFASLTGTGDFVSGLDDATVYGGLLGDDMEGGFGFAGPGFGTGGGGTGWGTLGTGRYSSLSGSSRGGRSEPSVRIGDATATGELDKNIIRRYIRRKLPRIKYCYEKQLLVKPDLSGTVNTQFAISPQGEVIGASASGVSDDVASCVAKVIETIKFPKPKGGGTVQVKYPFTFRSGTSTGSPSRRRAAQPQVRIGNATATGEMDKNIIRRYVRRKLPRIKYCYEKQLLVQPDLSGAVVTEFAISPQGVVMNASARGVSEEVSSCVAKVIKTIKFPKPKGGGLVQVKYPFTFRSSDDKPPPVPSLDQRLDRLDKSDKRDKPATGAGSASGSWAGLAPYQVGARNPLTGEVEALGACLSDAGVPYGVLFVELSLGDGGAVTEAKAVGLAHAPAAECVAKVARKVTFDKPDFKTYRCAVAFGDMPTDAAPHVDITAKEVSFQGERLAATGEIAEGDSQRARVDAVYDRLKAQADIDELSVGLDPIAITGPRVIRPIDEMSIKVVHRVARSAPGDWLLAAQDGDGWRLLHPDIALPIAPVPVETGGSWRSARRTGLVGLLRPIKPKVVTVLVTETLLWAGVTPANEFRKIPKQAEQHDWKALEQALTKHKKSTQFATSKHIDIAGHDQIAYATMVKVIDIANRVGFTDWRFIDPATMTFRPGK